MGHRVLDTLIVASSLLTAAPTIASSQRCSGPWELASASVAAGLHSVAAGNDGSFVAVGEDGVVLSSTDGLTWHAIDAGTNVTLRGVAAGSPGLVAVGDDGVILTSPDGVAWQQRPSGTTGRLNAVAWIGDRFVAVGAAAGEVLAGLILTSADGATWENRTPAGLRPLYGVAGDTGHALAVGWTGMTAESHDGVTWVPGSLGDVLQGCWFMLRPSFLYAVAVLDRRWIAVGLVVGDQYPGTGISLAREEDARWSCSVTELPPQQFQFRAVAVTETSYTAVGLGGTAESHDGLTWESQWVAESPHLHGVAIGPRRWVAVGERGSIVVRDCPARRPVRRVVRPGSR